MTLQCQGEDVRFRSLFASKLRLGVRVDEYDHAVLNLAPSHPYLSMPCVFIADLASLVSYTDTILPFVHAYPKPTVPMWNGSGNAV